MKEMAPRYLRDFRCIAGDCRHSCCIGWEIDVDAETLSYYRQIQGDFGKRLAENIVLDGETAYFGLGKDERCPFLNTCGLCDIYTELGKDALCQICTDHPRFRNYFSDRTEMGIGLCCEAAARLVLSGEGNWEPEVLYDDGEGEECDAFERQILSLREELFALLQREEPVSTLAEEMFTLPKRDWVAVYDSLEKMDPLWNEMLSVLSHASSAEWEEPVAGFDKEFRNLIRYFLYRHLPGAIDERDLASRVGFAYLGYRVIRALCAVKKDCTLSDLLEFARLYSSEIEYSEENTETLLNLLGEMA